MGTNYNNNFYNLQLISKLFIHFYYPNVDTTQVDVIYPNVQIHMVKQG